jgi:hypothetical protein
MGFAMSGNEIFYERVTSDLEFMTENGISKAQVCIDGKVENLQVVTLEDVTAAVKAVEKVHKVELANIYDFICENKDDVINGVQKFVDNHFEDYESAVQTIFHSLPDIGTFKYLLVEIIQFVADKIC